MAVVVHWRAAVTIAASMAIGYALSALPAEPIQITRARVLGLEGAIELDPLATKYGGAKHSRFGEEWIVRDFFQDRRGGTFLDVGAADYQVESNTYFLETSLGWSGLAIDAVSDYEAGYVKARPRTKFFTRFVSDVSNTSADLYVSEHEAASSTRAALSGPTEIRKVPTTTLNDLLAQEGIDRLDFVSMDIELHEPQALRGFDIERFRPALVCVEAHHEVRQAILDYFARHGYTVVGKYLRMDTQNLYFAPL